MDGNEDKNQSGWGAFAAFRKKSDQPDGGGHSFSLLTFFFILLMLGGVGYHTYQSAFGDTVRIYSGAVATSTLATTTIGLTLTPDNLQVGLVGHWTFDGPDMTTATATDRSGNGNNGTVTNGPRPTLGTLGQGLFFNGVGDYVRVPSIDDTNFPTNGSLSFWIKGDFSVQHTKPIFDGYDSGRNHFFVRTYSTSSVQGLQIAFQSDTYKFVKNVTLGNDRWNHVVVIWNTEDDEGSIFVDGTIYYSAPITDSGWEPNEQEGYIGGRSGQSFIGTLDDVRIYNRILSAEEIARLYSVGLGSTIDAAPLAGGGGPTFTCGTDTVTDADANVYDTILIGDQCWMQQNLRVGTRISGATAQTNNGTIEKWCYSNSDANCTSNNPNEPDGGLYQWDEAMQYSTTPGAQGICPAGWHIPTHDELTTLERAICTSGSCVTDFPYDTTTTGYRGTNEGTKLQPGGSSGFEFNLAGNGVSGDFFNRASGGILWSSSESGGNAWYRNVVSGSAQVYRSADVKSYGLSVRCLQD